jgi:hypothetical protein
MTVSKYKPNRLLTDYDFPRIPKVKSLKEFGGGGKMEKKVEKSVKIEDGKHTGIIDSIEYREEPYEYVDINIKENKTALVLKCGVPFSISENTALGQMLIRFGAKLEVGKSIEVEDFIKENLVVEFVTITEDTKKGTFARIQSKSLKPAK